MSLRMSLVLGLAVLLGAAAGCNSKKARLREQTKDINDVADALATVKDKASYEAAKPKLERYYAKQRDEMRKAREAASKNAGKAPAGQPSAGDMDKAKKEFADMQNDPDYKDFQQAMDRYIKELMRVMAIPEVGQQFMKEMMGF